MCRPRHQSLCPQCFNQLTQKTTLICRKLQFKKLVVYHLEKTLYLYVFWSRWYAASVDKDQKKWDIWTRTTCGCKQHCMERKSSIKRCNRLTWLASGRRCLRGNVDDVENQDVLNSTNRVRDSSFFFFWGGGGRNIFHHFQVNLIDQHFFFRFFCENVHHHTTAQHIPLQQSNSYRDQTRLCSRHHSFPT